MAVWHLVLPGLTLSTLDGDNGEASKNEHVLTENGRLLCVLPLAVHMNFF